MKAEILTVGAACHTEDGWIISGWHFDGGDGTGVLGSGYTPEDLVEIAALGR